MNESMRVLILMFMLLYLLSPVDAMPGPIDDIIVLYLGCKMREGLKDEE